VRRHELEVGSIELGRVELPGGPDVAARALLPHPEADRSIDDAARRLELALVRAPAAGS
jgi:hypothetical protein